MLRAILFDVDGTLVDSVDLHARAWQEALARYGRQVKFEQVRSQIGKGGDQLIPVFLTGDDLERYGEELDHFRSELYRERYLERVRPFPGVLELFQRIKRDGKRIILASSGKEEEVEHYLQLLGVRELIDGFTTSDDVERSKPHPDLFGVALKRAGVSDPAEALVVGDSPFDVEAAARIALPTVGLLCGGFKEEELRAAGVVSLYQSPLDLLERYDTSPLARDGGRAEASAPAP